LKSITRSSSGWDDLAGFMSNEFHPRFSIREVSRSPSQNCRLQRSQFQRWLSFDLFWQCWSNHFGVVFCDC
jgi:hypothetical protein